MRRPRAQLDYGAPPVPPLEGDDETWARELIARRVPAVRAP
jgi:hypothetical protein